MADQEFNEPVVYSFNPTEEQMRQPPIKFKLDMDGMEPQFMTRNGDVYRFNGKQWVKIESEEK